MAGGPLRSGRPRSPACRALTGLILAIVAVAGCGSAGSSPRATPSATHVRTDQAVTSCGTTKTAANVPVRVDVQRGSVTCTMAMSVERHYASAILAGREPGNGGGGPVKVGGWTCLGFATPVVLRTGKASKCVKGTAEILAILPAPA
jgi:hypothetical protein